MLHFAVEPGLSIFLCSWFFKSEMRYRVPFDAVFIPLSVLGWAWILEHLFPRTPPERLAQVQLYAWLLAGAGTLFGLFA